MATAEQTFPVARPRYTGILEWITTVDHKKIGVLYLFTTFFFFLSGGLLALAIRTQLATPDGTLLTPQQYNAAFTMHGTTMVFLFVVPVWTGFANYIIPCSSALGTWPSRAQCPVLMAAGIGRRDPVFELLVGAPNSGWTSYVPLSTKRSRRVSDRTSGSSPHCAGLLVDLGALNMIVTIFSLRAPGMTFHRITLFAWSVLVTSFLLVLAMPFLTGRACCCSSTASPARTSSGVGEGATAAVAVPVLVLRPPRGLHHDPARLRRDQRGPPRVLAEADLRLQDDRVRIGRDRLPLVRRVRSPHVRRGHRPGTADLLHVVDDAHRRAHRCEGLLVDRDDLGRLLTIQNADALLARLPRRVHVAASGRVPRLGPVDISCRYVLRRRPYHYVLVGGALFSFFAPRSTGSRR